MSVYKQDYEKIILSFLEIHVASLEKSDQLPLIPSRPHSYEPIFLSQFASKEGQALY